MYLKKVELVGFKSFADHTVLSFEPGMTAVVGPNGCGKSNIADAIRWVLGEQSAKALRGGSMQDVIFNGADGIKPLNMAEVSLTLAGCEDLLKTEYHEVTVTRRIFRNGDSQYFMNKQACRLKDIQRLFMDTGIGRNSYSILEQGKIDQILSSRPEDRRVVFEEASGITKYKADRKEALRKLEYTEQNLTRLEDVIREVKRRMISLQRQAGKARRYREIQERLRGMDLWLSRHKLETMQSAIGELEVRMDEFRQRHEAQRAAIHGGEAEVEAARAELEKSDKVIAEVMESAVGLRNELNGARQSMKVNRERIQEMQAYASRDSRDAEEARARLEQHRNSLAELTQKLTEAQAARDVAGHELKIHQEEVARLEEQTLGLRRNAQDLRGKSHAADQRQNRVQQHLRDFDERERGRMVRQERLREESAELQQAADKREARVGELTAAIATLREQEQAAGQRLQEWNTRRQDQEQAIQERRRALNGLEQEGAGLRARLDVLRAQDAEKEDFPAGARALLSDATIAGLDRSQVVGALAKQLRATPKARIALESVLRSWLDAVVVRDASSLRDILSALSGAKAGAARVLAIHAPTVAVSQEGPGVPFLTLIKSDEAVRPLAERLLGGVRFVEDLAGGPEPLPGQTFVTREGHLLRGDGLLECYAADREAGNPLARQANITEAEEALADRQTQIAGQREWLAAAQGAEAELREKLRLTREEQQALQRELAAREAELRNATRERDQGIERLAHVRNQLKQLDEVHGASDEERRKLSAEHDAARAELEGLRKQIEESSAAFDQAEARRNEAAKVATEHRIRFAEHRQTAESLERQMQALRERIQEFEVTIHERTHGVSTYQERVAKLEEDIRVAGTRVEPLEQKLAAENAKLDAHRAERAAKLEQVQALDNGLRGQRAAVEAVQAELSRMEVDLAERRVRYENTIQRTTEAYHLTLPDVFNADEPVWENGAALAWEELEREVEDMKAKLEEMGPVNLVAIEEFQEQEDRHQFLAAQQEDLLQAKAQLMEMIQKINLTTTEMFTATFNAVNENFQRMFKQLFGGGDAQLLLVDTGDVLESGIDIIARPPGKKPQTISLLSGGERTMTAVALLFSLYQVKPSPFCVLDELDAALDEANIGRFVGMVQTFLSQSQFIVITHNQKTIAASDVLYGVTQQRKGVSKIVSVKLTDHDKDPEDVKRSKQLAEV